MNLLAIAKKALSLSGYVFLTVLLLLVGVFGLLYSTWAQELARQAIVEKLNDKHTSLTLDAVTLDFPLNLSLTRLCLTDHGDTIVAARSADVRISVLPLLIGRVAVDEAVITDVAYRLGTPDSAMYMTLAADSIALTPAKVLLGDTLKVKLERGAISGGRVSMVMTPDTMAKSEPSPPQKMSIEIGDISLRDFGYKMRMMPTIDTLSTHFATAEISNGVIDMYRQRISIHSLHGSAMDARYIAPDSTTIAMTQVIDTKEQIDSVASLPWTIEIDSISFDKSHALYTSTGVTPTPGLDFAYIDFNDIALKINNFYNRATTVRVPLSISGEERCGVRLNISGELGIDSVAMTFNDVKLQTPTGTQADFSALLGMGDMLTDATLPIALHLDGAFAPEDMGKMFPLYTPFFAAIPSAVDIQLKTDLQGVMGDVDISGITLNLNRCVSMNIRGRVKNVMDIDAISGNLSMDGKIYNVNTIKDALLDPATAENIAVPPMSLNGKLNMYGGIFDGDIIARTNSGDIALDARWNGKHESYDASVVATEFPIQAFMPLAGLSDMTANVTANGAGYDFFAPSTTLDADVDLISVDYQGTTLSDIKASLHLADGLANVKAAATDPAVDFEIEATGNLVGDTYNWTANILGNYIDLYALKLMPEAASVKFEMTADAVIGPSKNDLTANINLADLFLRRNSGTIGVSNITAALQANDSITIAKLRNRDLSADFVTNTNLDSLLMSFDNLSTLMSEQLSSLSLDAEALAESLPDFSLKLKGGRSNFVNDILSSSKMSVRSFALETEKDSTLTVNGFAQSFDTGTMRLDTVYIKARQHHEHLHFNAGIANQPGNLDRWHNVELSGRVDGSVAALALKQQNIKHETGFDLGLKASASPLDSTVTFSIDPINPIIGYRQWAANDSNFISFNIPTRHIDANLKMHGGNSSLQIYTIHDHEVDSIKHHQEDIVLKLGNIHLADWIAVNPFAPPMSGDVNADMRLNMHEGIITGKGSAGINNFVYDREKVHDFETQFNVTTTPAGAIIADADVYVSGKKTITLNGALNDSTSTSPLSLDMAMIRFPLDAANPFIPSDMARMRGVLNGNLKIDGTADKPIVNGALEFDSTAVRLALTGTEYAFSQTPVKVRDSVIEFDNFAISGCNDKPLIVNGTVDFASLDNMRFNLAFDADNMMIVNTNRASKGADIFGKAYMSLNAKAHGSMQFMSVNADLSVNPGTNVTYIVPDAESVIANRANDDMVRFVNFSDSISVIEADTINTNTLAMLLDAKLQIEEGSILNVYLSSNGQNRVQLQPSGTLTYAMSPLDDGRLSGRLNINKGFVRYTPPFMSEKLFNFSNDSYVSFAGDMMNPTLNIKAVDVVKANVKQSGQNSRQVNFDVELAVTGTMTQMDVAFDLSTIDDISIANEIETMSPEQRANQAMNLLLYNVYSGMNSKSESSFAGNPLFSFLESQVNTWAANNIKGVDLSFGIDQYDRTVDGANSSAMSYSYQVSKSLFNDRFKIIVGGNYSTDANADENLSQNLINDISVEYFLNDTRTMSVKLFRHTGYESILEGEITKTGVGFVYRRKLHKLGDMFMPVGVVRRRNQKMIEDSSKADTSISNNSSSTQ